MRQGEPRGLLLADGTSPTAELTQLVPRRLRPRPNSLPSQFVPARIGPIGMIQSHMARLRPNSPRPKSLPQEFVPVRSDPDDPSRSRVTHIEPAHSRSKSTAPYRESPNSSPNEFFPDRVPSRTTSYPSEVVPPELLPADVVPVNIRPCQDPSPT